MIEFINTFNSVFYEALGFIRLAFPLLLCLGFSVSVVSFIFRFIKYIREKK